MLLQRIVHLTLYGQLIPDHPSLAKSIFRLEQVTLATVRILYNVMTSFSPNLGSFKALRRI